MLLTTPEPPALHVLTQNIRYARPETSPGEDDHWGDRAPILQDLLRQADADVIGTQEVLLEQIPVLDEVLGATHLRLGIGRDGGGRGEHNLLFLRRERFELMDWDQIWLSSHPSVIGEPGWDADLARVAVWALVRDRESGAELVTAVTHLDHAGHLAREKGAGLVAQTLREESQGRPVVLMGDFNAAGGDSTPWRVLRDAGFEDTHDVAEHVEGEDLGTFPDYGPPEVGAVRIDWILTHGFRVEAHTVHEHRIDDRSASDHASVAAILRPAQR